MPPWKTRPWKSSPTTSQNLYSYVQVLYHNTDIHRPNQTLIFIGRFFRGAQAPYHSLFPQISFRAKGKFIYPETDYVTLGEGDRRETILELKRDPLFQTRS